MSVKATDTAVLGARATDRRVVITLFAGPFYPIGTSNCCFHQLLSENTWLSEG